MIINLPDRLQFSSGLDEVEVGEDITTRLLDIAVLDETRLNMHLYNGRNWQKDELVWIPTYLHKDSSSVLVFLRSEKYLNRHIIEVSINPESSVGTVTNGVEDPYGVIITSGSSGHLLTRTD